MKSTPFLKVVPLVLLCAIGTLAMAQPKVPVSPEAAALAKMVNYPVNFNTGLPDIGIPLYTLQAGGLSLPIKLSYHAGGFKTQERATRSGLGWSLSADIQITRTVNGADDFEGYIKDYGIKAFYPNSPEYNYPVNTAAAHNMAVGEADGMPDKFTYKLLNKSGSFYFIKNQDGTGYGIVPVPYDYLKISFKEGEFTIVDTDGTIYYFGAKGVIDSQTYPQKYTELTGGIRTTFKCRKILNANRTEQIDLVYQPKAPVKYFSRKHSIEYYSNSNPCLLGAASPYATNSNVQSAHPGLTSYYSLLDFYRMYRLSSPRYMENFPNGNSIFHLPDVNGTSATDNIYVMPNQGGSYQTNYGLALTQINFRTGSVHLNGVEGITSIVIKNADGEEVKTINLRQSTTYPTSTAGFLDNAEYLSYGTRYLDSVEFVSHGKRFEVYKMQYPTKYCFGDYLQGKDAWGYANYLTTTASASTNVMAIRETGIVQRFYRSINSACSDFIDNVLFKIGNSQQGNVETTDETPLYAGMLRRLVYPTGGYVDFEYESNSARQIVSGTTDLIAMTGGLRIKTISHYDGYSDKPSSYKYYRYGELEEGTGIMINTPYQEYDPTTRTFKPFHYTQSVAYLSGPAPTNMGFDPANPNDFIPVPTSCNLPSCMYVRAVEDKTTYLPASSTDYTYPTGAPIYYTKVTEYSQDLGKVTGKKVHSFYPVDEFGPYSFIRDAKIPGTNLDVLQTDGLMGQPSKIEDYEYRNGSFELAHSKSFSYYKFSRAAQVRVIYAYQKMDYSLYEGDNSGYSPYLYAGTNLTFQNMAHYFEDIFTYGQYGIQVAKLLPSTETERWYSEGSNYVESTTAYEYNNTTYPQPTKIITSGKNNGTVSKVLKYAYDYPGTAVCDTMKNRNMIDQALEEISYSRDDNNVEVETARSKTVYADIQSGFYILPVLTLASAGGAPLDTIVTFDQYGAHENVLQLTEKKFRVKSFLWDARELYPVIEVNGTSYADATAGLVNYNYIDASSVSTIKTFANTIQTANPKSMVGSFAYKPMIGVTDITSPDGRSQHFSYDDYGRLLTIRDGQQRILKKHEYVLSKTPAKASTFYAFNNPLMLSFNAFGSDNVRRLVNVVQPGLIFYNPLSSVVANSHATSDLITNWSAMADGTLSSLPEANVRLRLNTWPSGGPIPTAIYLDLVKENTVVVSKRIPYNSPTSLFDELYVPSGTYKVAIRYETNYNGSLCRLTIGGNTIRTGDTLTLQANTTYDCILFNN